MAIIGLGFFGSITLKDVHSNWLSWLIFPYFMWCTMYYCLLNNLIVCTMFLPPFLHVDRKSVSTVPLLVQLDFKTFCRQNVFGLSYLNGFQSRMKVTFHVSLNHLPFSSVFFFLQLHLLQWVVSLVWGEL